MTTNEIIKIANELFPGNNMQNTHNSAGFETIYFSFKNGIFHETIQIRVYPDRLRICAANRHYVALKEELREAGYRKSIQRI